jgi:hypothetical protein
MDPVATGVGFLLGIIGAGFVAVLAQHLATKSARVLAQESFAEARRLQEEERRARERSLLVAVLHELTGNSTALKAGTGGTGVAPLQRSAWDDARRIVLPSEAAIALAMAYLQVDLYNAKGHGPSLVLSPEERGARRHSPQEHRRRGAQQIVQARGRCAADDGHPRP